MTYTKTIWANTPATTSPINQTNLNNIEDGIEGLNTEIEELKSKSVISIGGRSSSEVTYTISAWVWTDLNLNNENKKIGDAFELATNKIKCKKAMTILLSAFACFASTVNGEINIRVRKNSNDVGYAIINSPASNKPNGIAIPDIMLDVVENDIISFQFSGVAGSYVVFERPYMCYMTAKEI